MVVMIENDDVFIDLKQEVSNGSLNHCHKKIKEAAKFGCNKLMLNFKDINDLDNILLDFIISIKNSISSINLYNVDMHLLPLFYLIKLDQFVNFYTSENDALNEYKPIIKRRFEIVPKVSSIFLSIILVSRNIT
ncbi:MAG: hypothetical protein WCF95_05280 [bacterium]